MSAKLYKKTQVKVLMTMLIKFDNGMALMPTIETKISAYWTPMIRRFTRVWGHKEDRCDTDSEGQAFEIN